MTPNETQQLPSGLSASDGSMSSELQRRIARYEADGWLHYEDASGHRWEAPDKSGSVHLSWIASGESSGPWANASSTSGGERESDSTVRVDYDRLCASVVKAIHAQESGEDMTDFLKHALDACATLPRASASNNRGEP